MNLSLSSLAWEPEDDQRVADLLIAHGVHAIDCTPWKYFPPSEDLDWSAVQRFRRLWQDRGFGIAGLQAVLFGCDGVNLFGQEEERAFLLRRLRTVCRIAFTLHCGRIVFGSPKNRDRGHLGDSSVESISCRFFSALGTIASEFGVVVCLEANPAVYGCNFMTSTAEAARVVQLVNHSAIRLQLDTGAIFANGEDTRTLISRFGPLIGHVHVSEPGLAGISRAQTKHACIAKLLREHVRYPVACIEMLRPQSFCALEEGLRAAAHFYGDANAAERASERGLRTPTCSHQAPEPCDIL